MFQKAKSFIAFAAPVIVGFSFCISVGASGENPDSASATFEQRHPAYTSENLPRITERHLEGSIECLDLWDAKLTGVPEYLARYTNLVYLSLPCSVSPKDVEILKQLKKLKYLSLLGSGQIQVIPAEINELTNLESLTVLGKPVQHHERVFGLTNLQELTLSDFVVDALPDGISRLENLTVLTLRNSSIKQFPIRLKKLRELRLTHCQLGDLPEGISQLTNLAYLNVSFSSINTFPKDFAQATLKDLQIIKCGLTERNFPVLPRSLETLQLGANQLQTIPATVCSLTNLTELGLTANRIESIPPEISKLQNLRGLTIHKNRIETIPPEFLELVSLRQADFANNRIQSLPKGFSRLRSLKWLGCGANNIAEMPDELADMKSLECVDLAENRITTLPPSISKMTNLHVLYLSDNKIRTVPEEIAGLSELHEVSLDGNPLEPFPAKLLPLVQQKIIRTNLLAPQTK